MIITGAYVGHRPSPFRQWPAARKCLKKQFLPLYFLINTFLQPSIVSFLYLKTAKHYFYQIFKSQSLKTYCKQRAHVSMLLEGKFSNFLPVSLSLKETSQKITFHYFCGIST